MKKYSSFKNSNKYLTNNEGNVNFNDVNEVDINEISNTVFRLKGLALDMNIKLKESNENLDKLQEDVIKSNASIKKVRNKVKREY